MIIGRAQRNGVSVEVVPGGALQSLELAPEALELGAARLAATIEALVRAAAAKANRTAGEAIREESGELHPDVLAALGLPQDDADAGTDDTAAAEAWRR
ncbi:YbaB/EbfC family DNA-binding protein [Saccharopolyspora sp. ASAGF58]|uniref:YbaB/EbfC family DNA-binding protein n=1 Tax=Saccharopolyspora sp. ASAGF58 TaxID=2719023 RepID=UPI00144018E6|nr:YbaB/EbfC family DNA-binding protein [Saccharopolyspora sp. ASAGF58]QIZ38402.1 YbaB/EbfC family DNA-binding protein [Saccharopolyspora sp. ASAGF58]